MSNFNGLTEKEVTECVDGITAGSFGGCPDKTLLLPLDSHDLLTLLRGLDGDPDAAGESIEYVTDVLHTVIAATNQDSEDSA